MALSVLYEDDTLAVVDKPPGIVVHPTYKNWSATLLNGLLGRYQEPRIMTRLDRDTSGIVIVALGADAHARLQRASMAGRIRKEYLAIVRGAAEPGSGSISAPLARSPEDRRRVVIDPAGQDSRTDYEVLASVDGVSVIRCELITGRTHQIRVHLASRGWPILGDSTYGSPEPGLARQALHAWRAAFAHPVTGEPLAITASVPEDLGRFLRSQNFRL
jgi:23S rRNA pseudouridine1911/1915/1917 synthase